MKNYQFYHIYPLGMLGNEKISYLHQFIPHMKSINTNGLYLGPVFSSLSHGYDTVDYLQVDKRLGSNQDLYHFVHDCHQQDIDVILDCVFNHVSRDFFAFQDVLINKQQSIYCGWFRLDFSKNNCRNDGFAYDTWDGYDELVKLNLKDQGVVEYLLDVSRKWIAWFDIDGIRLDAADVMDRDFIHLLTVEMKKIKKDFYVVAEMVRGNYAEMIKHTEITSVTNYECYKGLYSSLNDANYFEIAYSLKRLFTEQVPLLYNFVDNHDVNRVASQLNDEDQLYPLYLMLYTIPGIVSLYYKSEFASKGIRTSSSDSQLRTQFRFDEVDTSHPLYRFIQKISSIRKKNPILQNGSYKEVIVDHQLIGYLRSDGTTQLLILINSSKKPVNLNAEQQRKIAAELGTQLYDLLDEKTALLDQCVIYPNWGRILKKQIE